VSALTVDPDPKPRVLIAGDQRATRAGLRLALADEADCSETDEPDETVRAVVSEKPDAVFVDFNPPARGIRATAAITAAAPSTAVIVMTRSIDEDEFVEALRAGASGYLSEAVDPERLPFVLQSLLRGEAVVPRRFVGQLIDELRGRLERRHHVELHEQRRVELTAREWEVLELLREGLSTRAIAERLGISAVTVRRHISAAHHKTGTHSRAELLQLLLEKNGNGAG
jgi:DNA-binding NarL/FixJ family response regulator